MTQQGQGDVVANAETTTAHEAGVDHLVSFDALGIAEQLGSLATRYREGGDTGFADDSAAVEMAATYLPAMQRELTRLRTLLSSSRGEQGWRTPDDLPELKDGDRFAVYLAFDTGEVKLADWVAWTETASEYHASTGVYLGQSPQDGDALYMTDDGFDVRKDDHGRWVSHKHHDDGTKTPFYVTAWTEALKPLPSAPGSVQTSVVPEGAIENGREFLRRLAEHYAFECDGGKLANCHDYIEAVRCFEHLAEYVQGSVPTSLAGQVPDGFRLVPETAIRWLLGEGPDANGNHFGDEEAYNVTRGRYWWRGEFRSMLSAAPQPTAAAGQVPDDGKLKRGDRIVRNGQILEFIESELEGDKFIVIGAAPQPTAGGDAPTDRASPIQPYGHDDDDNIFALLCARKDARTDTSAKAIAWAEDEIENLRSERNDLVTKVNALSAERARVIERCAMVADNYGREGDRLSKEYACEMADELAARIRALAQQDTGGDDGQE